MLINVATSRHKHAQPPIIPARTGGDSQLLGVVVAGAGLPQGAHNGSGYAPSVVSRDVLTNPGWVRSINTRVGSAADAPPGPVSASASPFDSLSAAAWSPTSSLEEGEAGRARACGYA